MFIKYIWETSTLVRSLGIKIEVQNGDIIEVNEIELAWLKNSYKRLFDFELSEKVELENKKADKKENKS
jgi:hypothetical protein